VNRRKPIKKDYFTFVRRWYYSKSLRTGLYVTGSLIIIGMISDKSSRFTFDASAIFGLLVLVFAPIIIGFILLYGLEKLTGISALRGVEWVGKYTLLAIDLLLLQIQKWRGISLQKRPLAAGENNTHVVKGKSRQINQLNIEEMNAAVMPDMESDEQDIPEPSLSEKQAVEDVRIVLDAQVTTAKDATGLEEVVTEECVGALDAEAMVEPDMFEQQIIAADRGDSAMSDSGALGAEDAEAIVEPDMFEQQIIAADQADSTGLDEGLVAAAVQSSTDNPLADLTDFSAELLADDFTEESDDKSTLQALDLGSNDFVADANTRESFADMPKNDVSTVIPNSLKELFGLGKQEKTDLLASKPKPVQDKGKNKPSIQDANDAIVRLIAEKKYENVGLNDKNAADHPAMFLQAEQTASNILATFSEKFSSSSIDDSPDIPQQTVPSLPDKPDYQLPSINLLQTHEQSIHAYTKDELEDMSRSVERVLKDYKIIAEVKGAYPGPIITRFELSLAAGVKVSRVTGLAKDLARALLVTSVRVVEIIEGTPYIGLEIPNQERELVSFREIVASEPFQAAESPITFALGKDVSGQTVVSDLGKMPHLLVAGTTGSGKSVAINTMILSILYKAAPEQVRMIMVDPKMLELSIYEGIPHLLTPVVTDMKEAQNALRWAVAEMERRYKLMSKVGVRNLAGFNDKITEAEANGEPVRDPLFQLIEPLAEGESFPTLSTLPSIVIVIDELADMMMIVGKKVEELIARLAQKARAAGIHLVLATQRPSVDVLTGLIKANVPTRISFQVSSRIDSRTILDQGGAEALLGNGDMLFLPSGTSVPIRAHGAFVADEEVHAVVDYLKTQGSASYIDEILKEEPPEKPANNEAVIDVVDALYGDAVDFVMETGKASISSVQRRFKVGYNRAARMIDQMEAEGIVSEPEGNGSRRVLNKDE
jgi:DNA segregation ATPase FtsK/SpoIIIE-like protein